MNTLPKSVKRKNLIAAYSFFGPPQMPIRKYIGHQRQLPEHVKEEQVERHEHTQHGRFQHQEEEEIFFDALFDPERGDDRHREVKSVVRTRSGKDSPSIAMK